MDHDERQTRHRHHPHDIHNQVVGVTHLRSARTSELKATSTNGAAASVLWSLDVRFDCF